LNFGEVGRRQVIADFGGGRLSSDAGVLLLRLAEERTRIVERFVERCMTDYRNPDLIEHSLLDMVKQRVFGLALGYEDLNDHDALMSDPLLAAAVGKLDLEGVERRRKADVGKPLASSSTLNRLELTPERPAAERYKRIDLDPEAADDYFVDYFVASLRRTGAPKQLVIDLDTSDVPLHGMQEGRFYHGYYGEYIYLPIYAFVGEHHLAVRLQTADADPSRNAVEVVERIVRRVRAAFPKVGLIVRADSGFSREELYAWCEANRVDYVVGISKNSVLVGEIEAELAQAKALHEESRQPERVFKEFEYRPKRKAWSRARRVVAKAEQIDGKANPRFVVTSLKDPARKIYEGRYCPRGEAENRIKEQQLYMFGKRASASEMRANQNRFFFSALAYMLVQAMRELGLKGTEHANARFDTIRLKLFKIAATVHVSVRKVWVQLSSHAPLADTFRRACANLAAAPILLM
jgi:hypothetical protein